MKTVNLGELISETYEEFIAIYKDPELASIATAALINDLLSRTKTDNDTGIAA